MTERTQLLLLQIVGAVVAAGIALGAAYMAREGYAIPAVIISNIVSALIAKLFATPLPQVTLEHVSKLPPPMAAEAARRAIMSLPPEKVGGWEPNMRLEQAAVVLQGISSYPPPPEPKP